MRNWLKLPAVAMCTLLLMQGAASAQTPAPGGRGRIVVHTVQTIPDQLPPNSKTPGLGLKFSVTVLDGSGAIRQDEAQGAELRIGNTPLYLNNIIPVKKRWALVILIDGSATFGSQPAIYNAVRDKLLASIGSAPEGANIELMAFDGEGAFTVPTAEFSTNKETISKALFAFRPRTSGNSCLNEGLYSAVRRLGTIGSDTNIQRKGVLVITGSVDNCGRRNVAAVIEEAGNQKVNIYAVGINGLVARDSDMRQFTDSTNGFVRMAGADNSNFAMDTMMSAIAQQLETGFTLYVPAGSQKAELTVRYKDGTSVTDDVSFVSDKSYPPPAEIKVIGAPRTSAGVRVNLEYRNGENVKQVQIAVLDKAEGRETVVPGCAFNQDTAEPLQTVFCPFTFGRSGEFAVRARAMDSNGREIAKSELFDVKGQPSVGSITIDALNLPKADPEAITITLGRTNMEGIDRFSVELLEPNGNTVAKSATVIAAGSRPLVMKLDNTTAAGAYKLRIKALDSQNKPIPDIAPLETQEPVTIYWRSALEKIWEDVRRNPWVFAIAAVALLLSVSGLFGILRLMRSRAYARAKPVEMALPEVVRKAAPKDQSAAFMPMIAESPSQAVKKPEVSAAMPAPKPQPAAAPAAVNMPSLVAIAPPEVQFTAPLNKSPFTVGRKDGGDSAALPIDHTYGVSRSHVALVMTNGAWFVRDDRSSNGTTINGKPLERGKLVKLNADDTLGLGPKVKLQFKMPKV